MEKTNILSKINIIIILSFFLLISSSIKENPHFKEIQNENYLRKLEDLHEITVLEIICITLLCSYECLSVFYLVHCLRNCSCDDHYDDYELFTYFYFSTNGALIIFGILLFYYNDYYYDFFKESFYYILAISVICTILNLAKCYRNRELCNTIYTSEFLKNISIYPCTLTLEIIKGCCNNHCLYCNCKQILLMLIYSILLILSCIEFYVFFFVYLILMSIFKIFEKLVNCLFDYDFVCFCCIKETRPHSEEENNLTIENISPTEI